jgi:lysophospholipase L1-like esterase
MRILFQGDSITDAGRRTDENGIGQGYVKYAIENIKNAYPRTEFEFINRGISGHKIQDLLNRWDHDAIDLQPDVISILIGVNDTWHHAEQRDWIPNDQFEASYRACLEALKAKTKAKIIIMEQFLCYTDDKAFFREDLDPKVQITRKLAREYADAFIPLDGIFASESITAAPTYWAEDGVHPTEPGARLIAKHYLEAFKKVIL